MTVFLFVIFYIYGAFGSFLFELINNDLWGDISIAMLTLFRVVTFEDWTENGSSNASRTWTQSPTR